ncbi:hypothetical protein SCUP234_09525 [Seiridium cupressi]
MAAVETLWGEPRKPVRFMTDFGQRLTFGVELESCVAYTTPDMIDKDEDERDADNSEPLPDYKELPITTLPVMGALPQGPRYRPRDKAPEGHHTDPGWWEKHFSNEGAHIRHRIARLLRAHGIPAVSNTADEETENVIRKQQNDLANCPGYATKDGMLGHCDGCNLWSVDAGISVGE